MDSNVLHWVRLKQAEISEISRLYPIVTLAYAQSIDGCLTLRQGQPTVISGSESKKFTHQLRALHDGILVGIGTVLADDPKLDVRLVVGESPRPVLVDPELKLSLTANVIKSTSGLIVFTSEAAPLEKTAALQALGVEVQVCGDQDGNLNLKEVLTKLYAFGIKTLMVEGGVKILSSFLVSDLWDLAVITIAPRWLGGYGGVGPPLTDIPLIDVQFEVAGTDILLAGKRL
ncbi:MAG: GTP cyclohydrolase [Anaerolineaceae bacterium]|nr:GTP cyclohydrolase [Anaerolineaceae bacterium]